MTDPPLRNIMIRRIAGIYYSPAGRAATMTEILAGEIGVLLDDFVSDDVSVELYDLLSEGERGIPMDDETVAVIGVPVYVGKIPLPAARALRRIAGSGAFAVAAVSYGGRTYGNALYELKSIIEDCGFRPVGAGAFLIRHNVLKGSLKSVPVFDSDTMGAFAKAASAKIRRLSGSEITELRIKPAPVEVRGRMPVHKISRIAPGAAAAAQKVIEKVSVRKKRSEWFL